MDPRRLNLNVEALPTGGFRAASADVPALDVQGDAIAGALQAAQALARGSNGDREPLLDAPDNSFLTLTVNVVDARARLSFRLQ